MSTEITAQMLDQTIAWCKQNAFWGRGADIQRMQDFYYEQNRDSVTEDWGDEITLSVITEKLNEERVSYRIYYSKDNLTRRIFIFRAHCTAAESKIMLDLGFVFADVEKGDADIPDRPVEEQQ
jgi:hypothetical protein